MIRKVLLLLIIISVAFNYYIEKKLSTAFSEIEPENLQYLEHHSNINFYTDLKISAKICSMNYLKWVCIIAN